MTSFQNRHIGPTAAEQKEMLSLLGFDSIESFIGKVVPQNLKMPERASRWFEAEGESETEALKALRGIALKNRLRRSYIGMGYYGTVTPPVIQRNILENPGWYTQYTPYQAEISQGRLEALLNYQTMICDLTGLAVANASLLDEATAAAEAMILCLHHSANENARAFLVSSDCHPQTIAVVRTRARALNIEVRVAPTEQLEPDGGTMGVLLQYPSTDGSIRDLRSITERAHAAGALVAVATDLLALTLLVPPGEFGADIAIGSSQRFGVPLWYGGPHAAFFAVRDELKRNMPGRLIGVSKDPSGKPGLRLALQTREQHIRREKATSNICTAQVLLAIASSMYAVYHGPRGLREIALKVHGQASRLRTIAGSRMLNSSWFDTLTLEARGEEREAILRRAEEKKINLRLLDAARLALSVDETVSEADLEDLAYVLSGTAAVPEAAGERGIPENLARRSEFLRERVFNTYHSETEFLRYVKGLESRDLSLAFSMIPLGSCTMKLNATSEMLPISWPEFTAIHPYVPEDQARGYRQLCAELEKGLLKVTGFSAVSFQPNSGAAGEYAGLVVIRSYLESIGQGERRLCLIPKSAHGTNPASAAMAGLEVVSVECDSNGNIELSDLRAKVAEHGPNIAAMMVTYPSTHGVFEEEIKKATALVHGAGAQIYMDGANLNALVGLVRPLDLGADLCHINLHKTFCIPHGGGGPGAGPIAVKKHLAAFLPRDPLADGISVSAANFGSAGILPIPWMYIRMMGGLGLKDASRVAILNANYIARRLSDYYPILYRCAGGFVAHECILDLREIEHRSGVRVEDVAKRLMDYGFHAPTMSWPVPGTLMVEPTESESKAELDRFCEAMISIRGEIQEVEDGRLSREDNPLRNAPHTADSVTSDNWIHPYSRERAAFPLPWVRTHKFWPFVGRVDNVWGDRNLVCTCM